MNTKQKQWSICHNGDCVWISFKFAKSLIYCQYDNTENVDFNIILTFYYRKLLNQKHVKVITVDVFEIDRANCWGCNGEGIAFKIMTNIV